MEKTKRLLALALAVSSVFAFAACGDSDDSSETTTTTTTAAAEECEAEEETPAETEAAEEETPAETEATEEETPAETEEPKEFDITQVAGYDENATETVFEFTDAPFDAWVNGIPSAMVEIDGESTAVDDFIDARSLDRDTDLHMVVEWVYSDSYLGMLSEGVTDQHKTQIVVGPARANGWSKFGDTKGNLICDYPWFSDYEGDDGEWVQCNGEDLCTPETKENDNGKSGQVWPDVFVKGDGFIKIGNPDVTSIEFTIPAEQVNALIDNAFAEASEDDTTVGWDGILFQMGGNNAITKITIDQGNVFLHSQLLEAGF